MSIDEKKKHPRVKTENLVSYVCIDDRGNERGARIGRTIDVSLGGILIETNKPIETKDILLTTISIDDEIMNMKGKVVYYRVEDSGMFRTGIQFFEPKKNIQLFVSSMIKLYSKQRTRQP